MRTSHLLSIAALAALPLLACAETSSYVPEDAVGQTMLTSGTVPTTRLDDPQIAEVLRAAFTAAVEESSMSAPFTPDANVAEYGRVMHEQYRAALDGEQLLIEEGYLVPQPSRTSREITFESQKAEPQLLGRSGGDFEQAFLGREIAFQQELLQVIDAELLPSVRSDAQRREILELRPVVARLLSEASELHTWVLGRPRSTRTM